MSRNWSAEWSVVSERRAAAEAVARQLQDEVLNSLRKRRPPAMQLLRAADDAARSLADAKAVEEDFLRSWRAEQRSA